MKIDLKSDPIEVIAFVEEQNRIINELREEITELKSMPDSECWQELVVAAYATSDRPMTIYRITSEWLRMRTELVALRKMRQRQLGE